MYFLAKEKIRKRHRRFWIKPRVQGILAYVDGRPAGNLLEPHDCMASTPRHHPHTASTKVPSHSWEEQLQKTTQIACTVWRGRRRRAWWGAPQCKRACIGKDTHTHRQIKGERKGACMHRKGQTCGHLVTNWPPNQIAIKECLERSVLACVCAVCGPWIFQGTMQSALVLGSSMPSHGMGCGG
jgi:hypothetical protein